MICFLSVSHIIKSHSSHKDFPNTQEPNNYDLVTTILLFWLQHSVLDFFCCFEKVSESKNLKELVFISLRMGKGADK